MTDEDTIFELLKHVEVKVIPLNDIENDYLPQWIPNSSVNKKILFSHLRDLIGGYARIRRTFRCSKLLEELLLNYEIEIDDSPNWGVSTYKDAIKKEFRLLSVPGTNLCGEIDKLFLWSTLYENTFSDYQDFEFEDLSRGREIKPKSSFELQDFPKKEISQAVINAGAGLGKTTLLKAITYKLSHDIIILPTFIPLSTLIKSTSVLSYLNTTLNDEYQVNIDWRYMCLVGRVSILFDGLDELSNTERQDVLTKIARHMARFPQTSFLLTVRDSSILTTNLDVKILEIKRLTDENIINFSKAYNKFGAKIDGEVLLKHSKHNSELTHLLRIPLFLSLLLAILKPNDNLPNSRDEILEKYIDILFSPEKYKTNQEKSKSPYLREVAEFLAYEGLNKEHIGFNEKEIKRYLRDLDYCDNPIEYLENLNKYGILSKVSNRLQFTYPTIQEYLASQYILEYKENEIGNSFEKIISRPWAQTMQFVLESYPNSNEIIKAQLEKDDDAFFTSLRLISRCIINGADIDKDTRKNVGDLLANAWISSESSSIMESIGHLLLDGWVLELPEKAEEYIIHGWALHYGGAEILTAKKDKTLTEKVLVNMLNKNIKQYHLHDWQDVVDDIAPKALELYIDRAIDKVTDKEEFSALRSLIGNLDESKIPKSKWVEIVKNEKVPSIIRFSIAIRIPDLVNEELKQLYVIKKEEWLKSEEYYSSQYEFKNFFWQMPECDFFDLVENKSLNNKQITELLDNLFALGMEDKFLNELLELYNSKLISDDIKFKLNLLLSSKEVFTSQIYATEQLTIQHIDNVTLWCFLIGHITKNIALKGLEQLSKRSFSNEEYLSILSSLNTGLNYIMQPTLLESGVLENRFSHPALPEFSNWLLEEFPKYTLTDIEYIKALNNISQISSEKIDDNIENRLLKIISNWTPLSNDDYYNEKDDKVEWAIISALRLCEREKIQLSEDCLISILKFKRFNLVNNSLDHLVKISDINTVETIINFHSSLEDSHMKGLVNSAIEKIANRLEIRVIRVDRDLVIEK